MTNDDIDIMNSFDKVKHIKGKACESISLELGSTLITRYNETNNHNFIGIDF